MTSGKTTGSAAARLNDVLDVAIVGGGVSGVYSAYRLVTADLSRAHKLGALANARPNGQLRVKVFELSDRIGRRRCRTSPSSSVGCGSCRPIRT